MRESKAGGAGGPRRTRRWRSTAHRVRTRNPQPPACARPAAPRSARDASAPRAAAAPMAGLLGAVSLPAAAAAAARGAAGARRGRDEHPGVCVAEGRGGRVRTSARRQSSFTIDRAALQSRWSVVWWVGAQRDGGGEGVGAYVLADPTVKALLAVAGDPTVPKGAAAPSFP
jgi:hypothetical protein